MANAWGDEYLRAQIVSTSILCLACSDEKWKAPPTGYVSIAVEGTFKGAEAGAWIIAG